MHHADNLSAALESTRVQADRERQRCEETSADLKTQNASIDSLNKELHDT